MGTSSSPGTREATLISNLTVKNLPGDTDNVSPSNPHLWKYTHTKKRYFSPLLLRAALVATARYETRLSFQLEKKKTVSKEGIEKIKNNRPTQRFPLFLGGLFVAIKTDMYSSFLPAPSPPLPSIQRAVRISLPACVQQGAGGAKGKSVVV